MPILYAFGQLILLLVGNAAVLVSSVFLFRRLQRAFRKRANDALEGVQSTASAPLIETRRSLPTLSPALLRLLVGETPKPEPRSAQGGCRSVFFLLLPSACMSLLPTPTLAQAPAPSVTLPPLHVDAPAASCVDVEVEGTRQPAFDCLNEQLKAAAEGAALSDPNSALDAVIGNAEPNKVGTFSYTGQSIRMGNAFGKSAIPQRPAAPIYSNALTAGVKP